MMKMNVSTFFSLLFLTAIFSYSYAGVKIVECEDAQGNRSFEKTCPPNTTMVREKNINSSSASETNEKESSNINIKATLYSVVKCDACDQVKDFLSNKGIPITEKDVGTDVKLQKELTDLSGALKVPTTVIGKKILTGFNYNEFVSVLKDAGYSEESEVETGDTNEEGETETNSESEEEDSEF